MYRLKRLSASHQCRVRGLVASCSTWVNQVAARTRGAPLPYDPTASLTPSGAVQKRISVRSGKGAYDDSRFSRLQNGKAQIPSRSRKKTYRSEMASTGLRFPIARGVALGSSRTK